MAGRVAHPVNIGGVPIAGEPHSVELQVFYYAWWDHKGPPSLNDRKELLDRHCSNSHILICTYLKLAVVPYFDRNQFRHSSAAY